MAADFMLGGEQKSMSIFRKKSQKQLPDDKPSDSKKIGKLLKKKSFKIIGALIIVLVIAGIILIPRAVKTAAALKNGKVTQRTSIARKGEISTSISGSGPVSPSNRQETLSKVESKVTAIYFKEGDSVKSGDLLMELDDTDAKAAVEECSNNLLQGQIDYENNIKDYNSLTITAPFDGQVKELSAEVGSEKNKNESILTLVDTSKLKVQLTFAGSGVKDIYTGKKATVYCQELMDTIPGTVTYVSSKPFTTASGGELYNVEIEIENPGALQEGMNVSADIQGSAGTISSTGTGELSYLNKSTLKSSAGGTVISVNARENEYVRKGDVLVQLQNDSTAQSRTVADSKLNSLQEKLNDAMDKLNSCKIYAPFDGTIVKLDVEVGDSVKAGDSLIAVANEKQMQFTVSVDELDIEKVKVGQEASVTVDALSATKTKPLKAVVSKIAAEGTSQNGVTTYPVTIKIDETENLKSGMNATAEIYITHKTDVLTVPLQAIMKIGGKNYVMVKGDQKTIDEMKQKGTYIDLFSGSIKGTGSANNSNNANNSGRTNGSGVQQRNNQGSNSQSNRSNNGSTRTNPSVINNLEKNKEYYSNAIPTEVEVGLNDASNIEITSGLKEGDIVILPPAATGSSQTANNLMQGGMEGGVPMMPSGGFQQGGAIPQGAGRIIRQSIGE